MPLPHHERVFQHQSSLPATKHNLQDATTQSGDNQSVQTPVLYTHHPTFLRAVDTEYLVKKIMAGLDFITACENTVAA